MMSDSVSSLVGQKMQQLLGQSRYRVDVHDCPHFLDVFKFKSEEELSKPWRYDVTVTCSADDIACDTLLMKPASFTLQVPVFTGARSDGSRSSSFAMTFTGIPYSETVCY
jgi:type VI secretion system secreted protein VgrG